MHLPYENPGRRNLGPVRLKSRILRDFEVSIPCLRNSVARRNMVVGTSFRNMPNSSLRNEIQERSAYEGRLTAGILLFSLATS